MAFGHATAPAGIAGVPRSSVCARSTLRGRTLGRPKARHAASAPWRCLAAMRVEQGAGHPLLVNKFVSTPVLTGSVCHCKTLRFWRDLCVKSRRKITKRFHGGKTVDKGRSRVRLRRDFSFAEVPRQETCFICAQNNGAVQVISWLNYYSAHSGGKHATFYYLTVDVIESCTFCTESRSSRVRPSADDLQPDRLL